MTNEVTHMATEIRPRLTTITETVIQLTLRLQSVKSFA